MNPSTMWRVTWKVSQRRNTCSYIAAAASRGCALAQHPPVPAESPLRGAAATTTRTRNLTAQRPRPESQQSHSCCSAPAGGSGEALCQWQSLRAPESLPPEEECAALLIGCHVLELQLLCGIDTSGHCSAKQSTATAPRKRLATHRAAVDWGHCSMAARRRGLHLDNAVVLRGSTAFRVLPPATEAR